MTSFAILIIVLVLGVVVGNIMLLKHTAHLSFKNIKQDPIENAKKQLELDAETEEKDNNNKS